MKAFLWGSQANQANVSENFHKQMINNDFGLGFLISFGNSFHGPTQILSLLKDTNKRPDLCVYHSLFFSRIEMSKDALPEKACQLDSRYWRITNAKGDVEEVQGPGVVGM